MKGRESNGKGGNQKDADEESAAEHFPIERHQSAYAVREFKVGGRNGLGENVNARAG